MKKTILLLLLSGLLIACMAGTAVSMPASSCLKNNITGDTLCDKDITLSLNQALLANFVVLEYNPKTESGTYAYQYTVTPWPNVNGNTVGNASDVTVTGPQNFTLPTGQSNYTDPNPISITVTKLVLDSAGAPAKYKITVGNTDFILTSASVNVSTQVPEFPTVAVPVAAVLGLLFVFGRKKGDL
jgi:hypothetical protein